MHTRWLISIFACFLLLISSCSSSPGDATGGAIKMALSSTSFAPGLLLYTQEAGIFEEHGVDVEFVVANTGADAMATLVSGDTQMVAGGITEALVAHAQGRGVTLLSTPFTSTAASILLDNDLAAQLSPTTGDDPVAKTRALDGLSLATPSSASSFTQTLLMAQKEVEFNYDPVYLTQSEMPAALSSGVVDGILVSAPISSSAEVSGQGTLWLSGPLGQIPGAGPDDFVGYAVSSTNDWLDANPEPAAAVLAALVDAAQRIESDPNAAKEVLRPNFSEVIPEIYDAAYEESWHTWTHPLPTHEIVQNSIDTLPESADFPPNIGDVDVQEFVAWDLVDAAK